MKFSPSPTEARKPAWQKCKAVFDRRGSLRFGAPGQGNSLKAELQRAFTIAELLVVMLIIGILAALALPALKGFGESNAMTTATQQLLDDVGYARQKAMNDRTTVYMIFLPPEFWGGANQTAAQNLNAESRSNLNELITGQYTSYALFSERSIGDQPGQKSPRYLTDWRALPEGMIIETNKFFADETLPDLNDPLKQHTWLVREFATNQFPFPPTELTNTAPGSPAMFWLPYIAFDARGQLVPRPANQSFGSDPDEYIPLAKGSLLFPRDAEGKPQLLPPDVIEKGYREPSRTNYVLIHIDWLTGRAKIEKQELR